VKNLKIVYLADDDQDDRFFIRQAIREAGAQVKIIEAENGLELLELIQQQEKHLPASLVLLDMNMPKMNGLETIAALRSNANFAKVPVVMISTSSHLSLVETAYQAGFDEFFVKPSSMEEFNTLGHQLIAQFHL
jgi:CheY-like chemotaxis protein